MEESQGMGHPEAVLTSAIMARAVEIKREKQRTGARASSGADEFPPGHPAHLMPDDEPFVEAAAMEVLGGTGHDFKIERDPLNRPYAVLMVAEDEEEAPKPKPTPTRSSPPRRDHRRK